jgi:parvulin-like peptidyl-prolyl isomerase
MMRKGDTELLQETKRAVLFAAILAGLAGCGGKESGTEKIVATAGDIRVTLAEFQEAYHQITPNYRPDISTLEGKRAFADDLVNKEILLLEAKRLGGFESPELTETMEHRRKQEMLGILFRDEIESQVEVPGHAVAELYDMRKWNARISHILLGDAAEARRIREEIVSGEKTFEEAAREHSMDRKTSRNDGSLGEIQWGQSIPEFQKVAFELEPGEISEPVETTYGVHLVRLDERLPQEVGTLEETRPLLRDDARRHLTNLKTREFMQWLEEKEGLTWNPEGLDLTLELIRKCLELDADTIPNERRYVPAPTDDQRKVVIASFSGRDWTIGEYVDFVAGRPVPLRVQGPIPRNGLQELIRSVQIHEQLLVKEAKARGLDQRPEVVSAVTRLHEQVMIEHVHGRFLQAADVTPEEVRAVYDSMRTVDEESLMIPERVDMIVLVHTERKRVEEGLRRIRAGEDEGAVCKEISLDLRTRDKKGRTGLIARGSYAPEMEEVAFSGIAGQGWTDPIQTGSGVGAVKVLVHEQPRIAEFEDVEAAYTRQLINARGETAFEEWIQEQRDALGVVIHDDVLELIGEPVS